MYSFKMLGGTLDLGTGKTYKRGDVVHSEKELDKQFGPRKFQRLDTASHFTPVEEEVVEDNYSDLKKMTLAELRKFAEDEEIDLDSATRKDEVLAAIRKAMG
jgi:hypothetical protein